MLAKGVVEVKPLIAFRAIKAIKGAKVAFKPLSSVEKPVIVIAETVACVAMIVI